jgi:hypothetical protein
MSAGAPHDLSHGSGNERHSGRDTRMTEPKLASVRVDWEVAPKRHVCALYELSALSDGDKTAIFQA